MIDIDNQLFKMYSSLEKLESLDKHYYKIDNYSIRNNRFILKADLVDNKKFDIFNSTCKTIHQYNVRDLYNIELYDYLMDRVGLLDIITSYRLRDSYRKIIYFFFHLLLIIKSLKKRMLRMLNNIH